MPDALQEIRAYHSWANAEYPGMDTRKLIILEALRKGNTISASCACCNVSREKYNQWLLGDKEFEDAVERACALSQVELVSIIRTCAQRDWRAAMALLQSRAGKEWASPDQKLAEERRMTERQKRRADLAEAQAAELRSRSNRNTVEASMWQKQFVTEEDQEDMIRTLAEAVNRPLLRLTPEGYQGLVEGKTPEEALEAVKGYLGRSQAEVVGEVLSGQGKSAPAGGSSEEEEEDEE